MLDRSSTILIIRDVATSLHPSEQGMMVANWSGKLTWQPERVILVGKPGEVVAKVQMRENGERLHLVSRRNVLVLNGPMTQCLAVCCSVK